MSNKQHIYISPHFDDAVLSCGGQIARLTWAGQSVMVATLFGGKPDHAALSRFAQEIHGRPLAGPDLVETRRQEDLQALRLLGAAPRQGLYLDCIYRQDARNTRWLYASEEALFGDLDPEDEPLVMELAQVIDAVSLKPQECIVYAPLGVGNHVDHQLAKRAGLLLHEAGYDLRFYEEYPYAVRRPDALKQALAWPAGIRWQAEIVPLDQASLSRKMEAICAYDSQVGTLFEPAGKMALEAQVEQAIRAVAEQTGQESGLAPLAERLWRIEGTSADKPAARPTPPSPILPSSEIQIRAGRPDRSVDPRPATNPASPADRVGQARGIQPAAQGLQPAGALPPVANPAPALPGLAARPGRRPVASLSCTERSECIGLHFRYFAV